MSDFEKVCESIISTKVVPYSVGSMMGAKPEKTQLKYDEKMCRRRFAGLNENQKTAMHELIFLEKAKTNRFSRTH